MSPETTREATITSNLGLVHSLAQAYRGRGVSYDDLVQEGTVGLVQAVERFDEHRDVRFSTYAAWWIRRALIDALGQARTIRIPAKARRSMAAVGRAESELRALASGSPTPDAIAERAGLSVERVHTLHGAARVTASLDEPVGEDGAQLADLVPDPDPVDPWRRLDEKETRREIRSRLRVLPERQREVLVRRYGLGGDEGRTHGEIATSLGIGEERSRQLEHEALHRLRVLEEHQPLAA
jgi:RNA polymerase primary sigma factor